MHKQNKPGYFGNMNLKPIGYKHQFTKKQVSEYMKCAKDPIYFAKKYVKVITLDKGVSPFDLYSYQEELVKTMVNNRFVIGKMGRQSGKCVLFDTKVRIRNKKTGEIKETMIGDIYETFKNVEEKFPDS